MKHYVVINNYQLGATLRCTPKHKVIEQTRLDKSHTKIVYEDLTRSELQLCEKCYGKKLQSI